MNPLFKEIRHNPLLCLLAFVPVLFAAQKLRPEAHTLLFVLSVLAVVPLAALLSLVTNSGRSAWFVGVLVLTVYLIFAMTLYILPPKSSSEGTAPHKTTERSIQRGHDEGRFTSLGATAPERSACYANFS
ncbi:hypothetical protein [Bradyrhizobium sp. AUGA SZCCT0042]|uniref:hypothetical protein n=1 Tax=Bradyrhizobium sp. AUGA SZCCT0042 TaxID=2807651 RepID=UPI0039089865